MNFAVYFYFIVSLHYALSDWGDLGLLAVFLASVVVGKALAHKGFSYLHVISPCVTFDKTTRTYRKLDAAVRGIPEDHDSRDHPAAMELASDLEAPTLGV